MGSAGSKYRTPPIGRSAQLIRPIKTLSDFWRRRDWPAPLQRCCWTAHHRLCSRACCLATEVSGADARRLRYVETPGTGAGSARGHRCRRLGRRSSDSSPQCPRSPVEVNSGLLVRLCQHRSYLLAPALARLASTVTPLLLDRTTTGCVESCFSCLTTDVLTPQ